MCQCPVMILELKGEKWENQGQSPSLRCKASSIAVFLLICFQLSERAAHNNDLMLSVSLKWNPDINASCAQGHMLVLGHHG